jgi:DNA-binding response OmpR family regulator
MSKRQALIVEDNADLSIIFAEALQAAGFETNIVRDGAKAMDRLRAAKPNIVILDLHLPHVSGKEILEQIRADEQLADLRVVIATADPQMADMLKGQSDLVLLKPISFTQLRDLAGRLAPTTE